MSDQTPETETIPTPAAAANPAIANATQALAVKELGETVAGLKRSVKKLWISVIVVAVLTVAVGVTTFVPSLRMGLGGRPNFQNGQFNGTFRGGTDGGTTNQGTTTNP